MPAAAEAAPSRRAPESDGRRDVGHGSQLWVFDRCHQPPRLRFGRPNRLADASHQAAGNLSRAHALLPVRPGLPAKFRVESVEQLLAAGDAAGHSEASVNYAGTPWGTTGGSGTQGTLYRGIPLGGMTVAERTSAQAMDPFTLVFSAVSVASQPAAPGSYAGTVRLTATTRRR